MIRQTDSYLSSVVFLLILGLGTAAFGQTSTTIFWKKDYIADANGRVIATATPAWSDTQAPNAPTGLHHTAYSTNPPSVTLAWTLSTSTDVVGYRIYRGPIPIASVGSSASSFADDTIQSNGSYTYKVAAYDGAGNFALSTGYDVPDTTAPSQPGALVASYTSGGTVRLTWTASTDTNGVAYYQIWKKTSSGTTDNQTDTASPFDDACSNGSTVQTCVYKIRAIDYDGNASSWSNLNLATTISFGADVAAGDVVYASHVNNLRNAVAAAMATANTGTPTWTDTVSSGNPSLPSGTTIKAVHVTQLRSYLSTALTTLGFSTPTFYYPDSSLQGGPIHRMDIQELRDLLK